MSPGAQGSPAATVLIPTFDHGETLPVAVRSVLAQTLPDFELFVLGDGVPESARPAVEEAVRLDPRIRYFDFPKGPRNGEAYRHEVLLREARGRFVAYLADDDLWLPGHLGTMAELLGAADFAHTLPIAIRPDGTLFTRAVDLSRPAYRSLLRSGINRMPLGAAAHTLELYRRLPHGWRTTPAGRPTDLHMWMQILEVPGLLVAARQEVTLLNFPSPMRPGTGSSVRAAELLAWERRLASPGGRERFLAEVVARLAEERIALDEPVTAADRAIPRRIGRRLLRLFGIAARGRSGSPLR